MGDGVDAEVRRLAGAGALPSVLIAVVDAVEAHDAHGYLVRCTARPEGSTVQARLCWLSAGPGRGDFSPVAVGAEVLILCPGGRRNRAVALVGLTGGARAVPDGWNNDRRLIVEPGGVEVWLEDGAAVESVVLESVLPDLQASLTELSAALKAIGIATPNTDSFVASLPTDYRSASLSTDKA